MLRMIAAVALVLSASALADDGDMRDKLIGSWKGDAASSKDAMAYTLEWSDDGMKISRTTGSKTVAQFYCKMATECEIKDSGRSAKVTLYFNGPKLVENETIGSHVVRRRFTVTGDGNTLELETIPIEPEGKTETATFKRVTTTTAKQ